MTILHTVYRIPNGQTVTTETMSQEYDGAVIFIFFYNGSGVQVTPTGTPTVSRLVGARYVGVFQYGQDEWRFNGPADRVKIDLAGVSGFTTYEAFVWRTSHSVEMIPPGAFSGLRAMTVQSYVESNVKNGVQYEVSALSSAVAAGANVDIVFRTFANPVVIKAREITFNGARLIARAYVNPTYTGGTPAPYFNLNTRNPVTGTVQILVGATVTNPGVESSAATYALGSTGQGNTVVGSYRIAGSERVIAPNTTVMLRITNTDSVAQDIATYATWYEGGTDLPI